MIATESTSTFSSDNTSGWIRPFVERFFGHMNDQLWYFLHHLARKSGHFTGFGLVALAFLRAWLLTLGTRPGFSLRRWRVESVVLAVAFTFLIANFDEWHQTLLPNRTGLFSDVILDTAGGSCMCLLVAVLCWLPPWTGSRRGRRQPAPEASPSPNS